MKQVLKLKTRLFVPLIIISVMMATLSIYSLYHIQHNHIMDETLRLTTEYYKLNNAFTDLKQSNKKISNILNIDYMIELQNKDGFQITHSSQKGLEVEHQILLNRMHQKPQQNFFSISQNNHAYHVSSFALFNKKSQEIGKTIIIRDITKDIDELNRFILYTILITTFLILILIAIYLLIVSKVEKIIYSTQEELEYLNNNLQHEVERKTEVLRGLTENLEKRIDEEVNLNLKKERLIHQNAKFIQIGETVSLIAHHWRQPLSSISLLIQDIEDAYKHDELDETYLAKNVHDATQIIEHLSLTIDHFKNFYQTDEDINTILLGELINTSCNVLTSVLATNNIKLELHFEKDLTIKTYVNELKQVIVKLITNAFEVLLQNKIELPVIALNAYALAEHFVITISDNGGGIDETIIEDIFNPYISTKDRKNSTGIGLFVVKSVIEHKCQGTISVQNSELGACFSITLPKVITE
jgi:two-component system, NtrC family, C4-dicarboxylate transport sensor histidine kinase DctB